MTLLLSVDAVRSSRLGLCVHRGWGRKVKTAKELKLSISHDSFKSRINGSDAAFLLIALKHYLPVWKKQFEELLTKATDLKAATASVQHSQESEMMRTDGASGSGGEGGSNVSVANGAGGGAGGARNDDDGASDSGGRFGAFHAVINTIGRRFVLAAIGEREKKRGPKDGVKNMFPSRKDEYNELVAKAKGWLSSNDENYFKSCLNEYATWVTSTISQEM